MPQTVTDREQAGHGVSVPAFGGHHDFGTSGRRSLLGGGESYA